MSDRLHDWLLGDKPPIYPRVEDDGRSNDVGVTGSRAVEWKQARDGKFIDVLLIQGLQMKCVKC